MFGIGEMMRYGWEPSQAGGVASKGRIANFAGRRGSHHIAAATQNSNADSSHLPLLSIAHPLYRDCRGSSTLALGIMPIDLTQLEDILRRVDQLPVLDSRCPDEIVGYDDDGLPG